MAYNKYYPVLKVGRLFADVTQNAGVDIPVLDSGRLATSGAVSSASAHVTVVQESPVTNWRVFYLRIGDFVHIQGSFSATFSGTGSVKISVYLPVPATASSQYDFAGYMSSDDHTFAASVMASSPTNSDALAHFTGACTDISTPGKRMFFTLTYQAEPIAT